MRNALWVSALGIIGAYAFFWVLGAYSFADVLPVSLVVTALAVAWAVHGVLLRWHPLDGRDPRLVSARERRGF